MALKPAAVVAGKAYAFIGAKGGVGTTTVAVNVATALAKLEPGSTLLIDLHVANGDAAVFLGAEPRFSIVDALENTHRLDEAFFRNWSSRTKSGVDLLASSDRVMLDAGRRAAHPDAARVRRAALPLHRARRAALGRGGARRARSRVTDRRRREPGARDGPQRQPDGRGAAAALRQGEVSVVVSRADRLADIGHEDVERAVGSPVKHSFPSDYRRALQALNKGTPVDAREPQRARRLVHGVRAIARGHRQASEEARSRPARFSLFGSRGRAASEESRS